MKELLICFIVFALLACHDDANRVAQNKIEFHLASVENYINGHPDPNLSYIHSIAFLETCTGIHSEADGTFLGKINPTNSDLLKWKHWYFMNRQNIKWNEQERLILLDNKKK